MGIASSILISSLSSRSLYIPVELTIYPDKLCSSLICSIFEKEHLCCPVKFNCPGMKSVKVVSLLCVPLKTKSFRLALLGFSRVSTYQSFEKEDYKST